MAEAFGVVGIVVNIIDLVTFTSKVVARLNEFQSSLNEVPKSLYHTKVELTLLGKVLQQIKEAIDNGLLETEKSAVLLPTILACTEQLTEIDSILSRLMPKQSDGRTKKALKSVDSVFQEGKIQNITKTIHRYIGILTFYFVALSLSLKPLTETKLIEIRQWLSAPDPSINYQKAIKLRQANTGLWFLQSDLYRKWKAEAFPVWLHGIPGCGKTVLSSIVLENILQYPKDDPGTAVAYFYFDFSDEQKKDPNMMVRSLICQLLQQSIKIPSDLNTLYISCDNGQRQPSPNTLFKILQQMIEDFPQTYIVVDALDESAERKELMKIVKEMLGWQFQGLHILLTSRKEGDIMRTLERHINQQNIIRIQTKEVDQDIQMYVHQRLSEDENLLKWRDDVRPRIESSLMEGAHGMFRWAACQLDVLGQCRTRKQLDKALSNLPPTLDETYNRILSAISSSDSDYAIRILRWLTFSARPLSLGEVAEIAALDTDRSPAFDRDDVLEDPLDVLSICSSLITVTTADDLHGEPLPGPIVLLAHYSVKEYLVSERIRESKIGTYAMEAAVCHRFIARCCLKYLLQFNSPGALNEVNFHEFALAKYTAQYWMTHVKANTEGDIETLKLTLELMDTDGEAYLTWNRIYDSDKEWRGTDFQRNLWQAPSPLYYASQRGMVDVARHLLLVKKANVNAEGGFCGNALQAACVHSHIDIVQLLLQNGADVHAEGGYCGNALQAACMNDHIDIVQLLLQNGADVHAEGGRYSNALQAACVHSHIDIVQLLLQNGADVHAKGGYYDNALQAACVVGHIGVVQLLLQNGADVHAEGERYGNALQVACVVGHIGVVQLLLQNGADVHAEDGYYGNVLQAACTKGNIDIVQLLLQNGADVHAEGGYYGNALQVACVVGHIGVVQLLLQNGADVHAEDGYYGNVLQAACTKGNIDIVQLLLQNGADVHAEGGYCGNALQAACTKGNIDIVQLLLQNGADVHAEGGYYGNALQAACMNGHIDIVQLLLQNGADVHAEGGYYGTALDAASHEGHEHIFRLLLSRGADIHHGSVIGSALGTLAFKGHTQLLRLAYDQYHAMRDFEDSHKRNAILLAARGGHFETFKFLISIGLDSGTKDAKAENLLHYAASGGSSRIVNLVLDNNPPTSLQSEHWSPLHWACRAGNPDVVERLVQAGFRNESVTIAQPKGQWTPISIAIFHGNTKMLMGLSASCKALLQIKADLGEQIDDIHKQEGFRCDGCISEIYGPRFHCRTCGDFDYCFMCKPFLDHLHQDHVWENF
ncbi:hypothetical protein ACMFMG_006751 [Clarireedia jacksonii]